MLIRFFVENFLSFNQEVEFSMVAGKTEVLPYHFIKGEGRNDVNVLKAGVIYGANASGKSNLIKAMSFAKKFIVEASKSGTPINRNYFKLDPVNEEKPSKFQFDFKINDKIYTYGFEIDNAWVREEWLYEVGKTKDKLIFNRKTHSETEVAVIFENTKFKDKEEELFAHFTGKGTPANRLFLTETKERNLKSVKALNEVFEWFLDKLKIIFPETESDFLPFKLYEDVIFYKNFNELMTMFNTGIHNIIIESEEVNDFKTIDLTNQNKFKNQQVNVELSMDEDNKTHKTKSVSLTKYNLKTSHRDINKKQVLFEPIEESDGTQRLFDIIPLLLELTKNGRVFIIDELDRSLHPNLTRSILELFLENSKGIHSQLIVTTHESSLLDLKLLRKDEIWFTEKNEDGETKVYSLEEFHPRYDKEIRKGYLQGRFGAIPFITNVKDLGWLKA